MRRRIVLIASAVALLAGAASWMWPRPRPHVLLVTLDTTRADRLGCYGYAAARTPELDSLAASGVLCERAYTVAPLTLPAHASLFTGLYPAENGVCTNGRGRLDDSIPTLAEILKQQGYDTGAFVASFVLDEKFGLGRGFRIYDDDFSGDEPEMNVLHRQRRGAAVVDAALAWLGQTRSQPFFCWVHLYDPHAPYQAHSDLFRDEFANRPYDAEIAYVDRQVGRLVDYLKTRGLESQTLVVIAGDHGEGLGDHVERTHGSTLYNATMHVPLLMRQPNRLIPGRRISANVSLVDVSPTLLDLMGIANSWKITGKSFKARLLGSDIESSACYGATDEPFLNSGWSPLRSLVIGSWKYIRTTNPELYDLSIDPHERKNLAEVDLDNAQKMAAHLAAFESQLGRRAELRVQLSPTERRVLASLGYAGGSHAAPGGSAPANLPDIKDMLPFDIAVDDAGELVNQGALDAAISQLREVIQIAPAHIAAYSLLAQALQKKLEFGEAAEVFLKLLDVQPESRDGHYGLGHVLLAQGRPELAIAEFTKAVEIDPDFGEGHYHLAAAYANTGRPDEALVHFDIALENDPRHAAAHQGRANVLANLGRIPEAIDEWTRALRYDPRDPQTHHHLGVVLADRGELDAASKHLSRAVELNPMNAKFRYALGDLFARRRRYDEAVGQLAKALELEPEFPAARERLRQVGLALEQEKTSSK